MNLQKLGEPAIDHIPTETEDQTDHTEQALVTYPLNSSNRMI